MESIDVALACGRTTKVDAELWDSRLTYHKRNGQTLELVPSSITWRSAKNRNYWYAFGRGLELSLHRLLTQCESSLVVDHLNGDTLDNRLENLRCTTIAENSRREFVCRGGASKFRGVCRNGKRHPWRAQIHIVDAGRKRCLSVGVFATEIEAAIAYDKAAIAHFGPLAVTNASLFGIESVAPQLS